MRQMKINQNSKKVDFCYIISAVGATLLGNMLAGKVVRVTSCGQGVIIVGNEILKHKGSIRMNFNLMAFWISIYSKNSLPKIKHGV